MNRVDGFDFWVEDKETGEQVIADDISYIYPNLCQCDIEGFAITDEGRLIICDECGNFEYLNMDDERYIVHKGEKK